MTGNYNLCSGTPFIRTNLCYARYADTGRPVVIRNATLDWPAMSQLSFQWLKAAYLR